MDGQQLKELISKDVHMSKAMKGIVRLSDIGKMSTIPAYGAFIVHTGGRTPHWLLIFCDVNAVVFFDSYCQKPSHYSKNLENWLKKSKKKN